MMGKHCLHVPLWRTTSNPAHWSQGSHSSVYGEVSVISPAHFPRSCIPSTVPFHSLASSPRNQARGEGAAVKGRLANAPRILRGSRNPLHQGNLGSPRALPTNIRALSTHRRAVCGERNKIQAGCCDHTAGQKTFIMRLKVLCIP